MVGKISSARAWLETNRLRENASFEAKRTMRRRRIQKFYRANYELDPDKHTYNLEDIIDNIDEEAEEDALKKMRDMEWTRSDSLLSLLPINDNVDPLSDPLAEHFVQHFMDVGRVEDTDMEESEDDFYDETDVE